MRYVCILILAFEFVFLLRMVLSFFPIKEGTVPATVRELAMAATEPVVFPLRRSLPPLPGAMAGFGIAELVVLIGLQILGAIVCGLA
ncbi:MAG: YggT family protein [Acidimicrobiales bacterium]